MMSRVDRRLAIAQARSVYADSVAQIGATPGLVERNPPRDAVSQAPGYNLGIIGEGMGRCAIEPAADLLQLRGEIPVIERREGLNIFRQQRIHQAIIKIQACRIDDATPLGQDTRPGNRETIRAQAKLYHQVGIFLDPVVVVGCHLATLALIGLAWRGCEIVPDAGTPAILASRALDLIRGRGCTPKEMRGKSPSQVSLDLGLDMRPGNNAHVFSCLCMK